MFFFLLLLLNMCNWVKSRMLSRDSIWLSSSPSQPHLYDQQLPKSSYHTKDQFIFNHFSIFTHFFYLPLVTIINFIWENKVNSIHVVTTIFKSWWLYVKNHVLQLLMPKLAFLLRHYIVLYNFLKIVSCTSMYSIVLTPWWATCQA